MIMWLVESDNSFEKLSIKKNKWDKFNLSRPNVPADISIWLSLGYKDWDKYLGQIQFVPFIFLSQLFFPYFLSGKS